MKTSSSPGILLRIRLAVLSFAVAASQHAQNNSTFHAGVSLVHVDTEILSRDGRPLTGLTREDFQVLDSGQEQPVVAFSQGEQPLDLILLFDVSGSMHRQTRRVAEVAREGLQELRQGDRVSVMVFTSDVRTIAGFSDDLNQVEAAIHHVLNLPFRGDTRIIDSIGKATSQFPPIGKSGDQRRRAMLVTTDDVGWPSLHKTLIIENLWEADVLVGGLVVELNKRPPPKTVFAGVFHVSSKPPGGIDNLVEETGGDIIRSDDLSTSFPEMMHRIRSRYTLYYRLPEGEVGALRTIDVQLTAQGRQRFPGARVLARRGYRLQPRDHYGFATR